MAKLAKNKKRPRPTRCLLVLPASLGDGLAVRGLVASVAAARRQLIAITRGAQAALFDPTLLALRLRHTPDHLDAPLSLERRSVSSSRLRQLDCDEAIVLDRSWWVARAKLAGIPRRSAPPGLFSLYASRRLPAPKEHASESAPLWAESLGAPWQPTPTVHVSSAWQRLGRERLMKARVDLEAPKVGLYRGTEGGRSGSWPDARFEELARELRRRHPKIQIIILSTDKKRDLWKSVLLFEGTGKIHPVIGPELGDDGLGAVLSHLDLVVAADSAMLQIAAAVGTPTLGLFDRAALRRAPRGPAAESIQRSPLRKVGVDEVLDKIVELVPSLSAPR